ncbi:MAG: NAD(+)/NADH kinase [Armatimonadetes bacterium]|nr:NAD(+)/NADH kinase [Armatimonadota bacterium]
MKTVGLAPNPLKTDAVGLVKRFVVWLEERHVTPVTIPEVAATIGRPDISVDDDVIARSDLLVVLGGDGTMLRWSRLAAPHSTPMLGVNFGHYGFITEIEPDVMEESLSKVLSGDYHISERVVLCASVVRKDKPIATYYALNDVVVSKGPFARMASLRTYVNERFIVTYAADGIIISSPTGSTAYSLSAGGPVVHQDVSVLIVTPVCPHTLNVRSMVVPDTEKIQIIGECSQSESELMLTLDGQLGERLGCEDVVEVGKAEFAAKLIQFNPHSFYDKLQTRMRWGERYNT